MPVFTLDTNIVIKAVQQRDMFLRENITRHVDLGNVLCLSTVAYMELRVGVLRSSNPETAKQKREKFLTLISEIWDFDSKDAEVAAELRSLLLADGNSIGAYDLLIAAQALRRSATVITNNARDFERVRGLNWADWTKP